MRIQYASDLHLEFRENSSFLKHNPLAVAGEVLVLAGDIGYIGDENYSRHPFWDWASGNYSRVIVVPGNHEFYKMFDIDKLYNGWSLKIRENITCHYNAVIPLGNDIELIATTLWSHILLCSSKACTSARSKMAFTGLNEGGFPIFGSFKMSV